MFNRLNRLSFVIGLFFSLMAVILAVHALAGGTPDALSLYSAAAFLIFGIIMILIK